MSQDFEALLASLNDSGVRYLIGGAHALAFHARPRATKIWTFSLHPHAQMRSASSRHSARSSVVHHQRTLASMRCSTRRSSCSSALPQCASTSFPTSPRSRLQKRGERGESSLSGQRTPDRREGILRSRPRSCRPVRAPCGRERAEVPPRSTIKEGTQERFTLRSTAVSMSPNPS